MLKPFRVCMCVMSLTFSQRMLKFKIIFASITLNRRFPSNRKTPSDTTVHEISSSHSSVWRHEVAKHTMFEDDEGKVARPFQNAITGRIPDPTCICAIQHLTVARCAACCNRMHVFCSSTPSHTYYTCSPTGMSCSWQHNHAALFVFFQSDARLCFSRMIPNSAFVDVAALFQYNARLSRAISSRHVKR